MEVKIYDVIYNPKGVDLPGEYVIIGSKEEKPVCLHHWVLKDLAGHIYVFPDTMINPGQEIKIWTKVGTNDQNNLYWNRRHPVWNNLSDIVFLKDENGQTVDQYKYTTKFFNIELCMGTDWTKFGVATEDGRVWLTNTDSVGYLGDEINMNGSEVSFWFDEPHIPQYQPF
ncbi:lamin tail domain-containing protein [Mobilitalea sibirica]|uniref:Lamin tail domain-containing protein n=1 Tax=Mobilitalea sibirica TaxID=1462919 RepID=A0A8J7H0W3_9FIRM|nr:lamin tail domain-containing protein [Mobilitalea sibirica]MBH1939827.1 lamin tail domain-containing protein [Mobilitalea sibirica]